jgi:hypothetical protein
LLQPSRIDPLQHSHDDFQPFPRGFYTYCFEHLELFYEYIQPTLCSDFSENSYKATIPKGQQEFNSEGIHPSFSPSCCIIEDTTRNYLFDANLYMGNFFFFNLWFVASISIIQPHIKGQQTMICEKKYFLRAKSMSHFSSMFSLDNHGTFFKFLLIPYQTSGSDESQGSHSLKLLSQYYDPSSYHNLIQRWVEKACRNTSQREHIH